MVSKSLLAAFAVVVFSQIIYANGCCLRQPLCGAPLTIPLPLPPVIPIGKICSCRQVAIQPTLGAGLPFGGACGPAYPQACAPALASGCLGGKLLSPLLLKKLLMASATANLGCGCGSPLLGNGCGSAPLLSPLC